MIYGSIEDKKKAIRAEAEALRSASRRICQLKALIKQFDGKVYNKRFDEAIRSISDDEATFCGYVYYERYTITFRPRRCGSNHEITLVNSPSAQNCTNHPENIDKTDCIFTEKKRIVADKIIEALNSKYAGLLREAAALEQSADDLENILDSIDRLKRQINKIVDSLPYKAVDACGLKCLY